MYPNVIVYEEKHAAVVNYLYNLNYHADKNELSLDPKQRVENNPSTAIASGDTIHVLLTGKIQTTDGNFINQDIVLTFHT